MNPLLIVIPSCADDAPRAEQLLDWIYQLNGKQAKGHVSLAYTHDVHAEMKLKLRICAELAFESVSEFQARATMDNLNTAPPQQIELKTKTEFTNNLWSQTARHVASAFRWPFLYCEPDCVPITPGWIQTLADAYANQPLKYMGTRMKRITGETENFFMARTSIYPTIAYSELRGFIGTPPFEWVAGPHVDPRAAKTKLIQQIRYDGDYSKVKPEAVLLHSDKAGKLIEQLREKLNQVREGRLTTEYNQFADVTRVNGHGENVEIKTFTVDSSPRAEVIDVPMPEDNPRLDPEPTCDKRKKEWRDWNKRQQEAKANG